MLIEALPMDAVAALHETYGLRGCEHVVTTYGTVAVRRPLNALMIPLLTYSDAGATCLYSASQLKVNRYIWRDRKRDIVVLPCNGRNLSRFLFRSYRYHSRRNGRQVCRDRHSTTCIYCSNTAQPRHHKTRKHLKLSEQSHKTCIACS